MNENKRFIIEPITDVSVDANYKVKDTTDSWFFLTDSMIQAEFLCEKMNSITKNEELLKEKVYRLERENEESYPDFSKDKINGDFEKIKLESDDLIKSFENISYFFKKIFDEWIEQKEVPLTRYDVEYNNVTLQKAYQIILDVKEVKYLNDN